MKKHLLKMRFMFILAILLSIAQVGYSQVLLEENFNYTIGDILTDHGWTAHSGAGTNPIDVVSGLTFDGYASSGIGGAANVDNTGEDVNKTFTEQTSGTIYVSFIIQTESTNSAGYFFNLGQTTIGTTFFTRVWVNATGDGVGIGSSTPTTYIPITAGTPTLIVAKLDYATKVSSLFVFSSFPSSEPGTADTTFTETASYTNVGSIALRQYNAAQRVIVDGIRVGATWNDAVAPDATAPVATWEPTDAATGINPASSITITYNEAIRNIDDSEITDANVGSLLVLKETDALGANVAFTATIDVNKKVITITPDANLAFSQNYYVAIAPIEDAYNNATLGENITFTTKPDTDKDSKVVAPVTQVAAATVESVVTDSIPVFSFTISDLGTLDGMATKVTQITLKAGANNTVSFTDNISGGYLISESGINIPFAGEPNVTAGSIEIPFAVDALTIPDGEDSTYTVYLLLNTTVDDGSIIQLMIEGAAHGFVADPTGSEFAADFGADVVGNNITLNVTATDLFFFSEPVNVYVGNDIEPSVKVNAVDSNGNVDTDYITDISLTATGATLVGSPVTAIPVMGKATFSSVAFSDAATGVTLTAASGTLNEKVSAAFDVLAVPETDLFISEYVEGATFGYVALEIYNPTANPINLSAYKILGSYNGGDWNTDNEFIFPNIELAAGDVYVITRTEAPQEILDVADSVVINGSAEGQTYVMGYTGDDARALAKTSDGGSTYDVIDIIGVPTEDPGSGWDVAGTASATNNHTLIRKVTITHGTIDWGLSAGTTAENSEWKIFDADFIGNIGAPTPEASSETAITGFTFGTDYDLEEAVINEGTSSIDITVINGTDVTALSPTITLSAGATIDPLSGDTLDFTLPVVYTVTAEDGITTEAWTVTVTVSPTLSSYAEILEIEVADMDSAVINSALGEITVYMPYGSDVSSVKPLFDISAGATIADTTLAYDFATPQTYTVTAQDASTKAWEVTMEVFMPQTVSIHDIQYTTDPSGDSPYKGQMVKTSGIVTAVASKAYFVQDGVGAWNGVYVYINSTPTVAIGDSVEFVTEVDEYYNLTELKNVQGLVITSSGNTLPAATTITTLQAQAEDYEGVLIFIDNAECTDADLGYGMFQINDGSGALTVDDDIYAFTSELGTGYDMTGLGYYSFSEHKIIPRSANDIVSVTPVIGTPSIDPIAPASSDNVTVTVSITDNDNTAAQLTAKLFYGAAAGSESTEVTFAETSTANEFEGIIPASATTMYYKITVTDGKFSDEVTGSYNVTTVGINDPSGFVTMNIYPNPNNGQFTLELNAQKAGTFNVEIVNVAGQVVYQKQIEQDGLYKEQVNISEKAKGMYYIRINDGTSVKVQKLMIQ